MGWNQIRCQLLLDARKFHRVQDSLLVFGVGSFTFHEVFSQRLCDCWDICIASLFITLFIMNLTLVAETLGCSSAIQLIWYGIISSVKSCHRVMQGWGAKLRSCRKRIRRPCQHMETSEINLRRRRREKRDEDVSHCNLPQRFCWLLCRGELISVKKQKCE